MTLGERIVKLRRQQGLSQDALAEALGVSRQSVSKWETDASVPDLERLVKLSDLFEISLDELVKGRAAPSPAPEPAAAPAPTAEELRVHRQKLAGIFLMAAALLLTLLQFGLLMLTFPIFLLGLLCLLVKSRVALALGWSAWIYSFGIAQSFTSAQIEWIFFPGFWQNNAPITLILSVLQAATLVFLAWRTIQRPPRLLFCWLVLVSLAAVTLLPRGIQWGTWLPYFLNPSYYRLENLAGVLMGWGYAAALVWTAVRTWKQRAQAA